MNENIPDLAFIYPENIPDEIINSEIAYFNAENLNLKIEKINYGPFASFEWVVPTIFAAYILKPYFEGFLSEAGKDHYQILKNGLKKWIEKGKLIEGKLIAASNSPNKLSKKYNQSIVISVSIQTINNRQIKMLFDNDLEKKDWDEAINQLLDLLEENYSKFPKDRLSKTIEDVNSKSTKTIYGKINPKTKKVEFFDDNQLVLEFKNQS
jgi:hypothetical protein